MDSSGNGQLRVLSNGSATGGITLDSSGLHLYHNSSSRAIIFGINESEVARFDTTGNFDIANDSGKIRLGASNDLQIYHDGSESLISNANSGVNLVLKSAASAVIKHDTETMAQFIGDGAVELYHDNSKKFETTSTGVSVTGNIQLPDDGEVRLGADSDIRMFHSGTQNLIQSYNDKLFRIQSFGTSAQIRIQTNEGENNIVCSPNAGVELYYDNSVKFETTSANGFDNSKCCTVILFLLESTGAAGARILLDGDSNGDGAGGDFASIEL